MKRSLPILTALMLQASASEIELRTVKQPIYLREAGSASAIWIKDVSFVSRHSDPEWRFTAISEPFIPPTDGSWQKPHDVNLTSLYGIKVRGISVADSHDVNVTIDATKAKVPEGYTFTIAEVIDSVTSCVKLMYPPKPEGEGELTIKVLEPTK
jgi:hypothetical protein